MDLFKKLKFILFAVSSSIDPSRTVMTRLPSPSSRSSSEIISPLDLASGLTARLQAASFQPFASDCAVLPDLIDLGAGVPLSLLSVVEEGLGSPSERVSSGVGNDGDKIRLTQPGKSDF